MAVLCAPVAVGLVSQASAAAQAVAGVSATPERTHGEPGDLTLVSASSHSDVATVADAPTPVAPAPSAAATTPQSTATAPSAPAAPTTAAAAPSASGTPSAARTTPAASTPTPARATSAASVPTTRTATTPATTTTRATTTARTTSTAPRSTTAPTASGSTAGVKTQAVTGDTQVFESAAAAPRGTSGKGVSNAGVTVPVAPAAPAGTVTPRTDLAPAILALTNAERAKAGLPPVSFSPCITSSVAQPFSQTMATQKRTYHHDLMLVITACGGRAAGENVASGQTSPEEVVAAWMASPGHKANILNGSYKTLGIGVAQAADGTYYWVQNFNG